MIGRNTVIKWWERVLQAMTFFLGIGLVGFCVIWNLQWPPRTVWEKEGWCWARQVSNSQLFGDIEWHCVCCITQACIENWSQQAYIATVDAFACYQRGGFK